MERLSAGKLAVTFCGCFLGAGLVSGQELWQFFGAFGLWGFVGLGLAMVLFFAGGILIFRTATKSGLLEMDRLMMPWNIPWLRHAMGGITAFFMFGILVIMAAGADALLTDTLGAPKMVGSGLLCALVVVIALIGLKGMVAVFSYLVPLLTVCSVAIGCISVGKFGFPTDFPVAEVENPLLSNWWISAVTYVAYNVVCSIGILAPLSRGAKRRTAYGGTALGVAMLLVIGGAIMLAMASHPQVISAQLPMLELAMEAGKVVGAVYGVLLFGGMFGAGQSCAVAVVTFLEQKCPKLEERRALVVIPMALVAWIGSGFGFGTLVGTVYPVFGYISMLIMVCLVVHAAQLGKQSHRR